MKGEYKKVYEKLERDNWWWQARRKIVINEIDKLSKETEKQSLLDVGCGSGHTLKPLRDRFDCVGIEPDKKLLKIAKKISGVKIVPGSLPDKLPQLNTKFDFILLLDVLEHIKKDKEALLSLNKHIKKDGYLILNVPAMKWMWSVHDEINEHQKRYEKEDLRSLLENSGFIIQKLLYWGFMLTLPALLIERRIMGEVFMPPRILNSLFYTYTISEYKITQRINAPFGLSLIAIVKPGSKH